MTKKEKENSEKAVMLVFTFYMLALLASSIYSYIVSSELNTSFVILMAGLIIFFISDFLFNKFGNKK